MNTITGMAFHITVYGAASPSAEPSEVYDHPLGGTGTVLEYWARPARSLGLPILGELSEGELTVDHDQLEAFTRELSALARHWAKTVPDDASITGLMGTRTFTTPLLSELLHRLAILRSAIRIAELSNGHIEIA